MVFSAFTSVYLLGNTLRAINSGWRLHLGFNLTGGLSSTKFETIEVTTNSLRNRANQVAWSFVSQESAVAYECTYESIEGGAFLLLDTVDRVKLCCRNKSCYVCDSICGQREQAHVQDVLTPPKQKKKKRGEPVPAPWPHRFKVPLQKQLCDNTTKFSKFINKRLPHLKGKVLQCAVHIAGIACQIPGRNCCIASFSKIKPHTRNFTSCWFRALSNVLQRKLVGVAPF